MQDCASGSAAGESGPMLSVIFRTGLAEYDLKDREVRLASILCLETYDQGRVSGLVDFEAWAKRLRLIEDGRVRPDRCRKLFQVLADLQIVDWNVGQGTYELRPYWPHWSHIRGKRLAVEASKPQDELNLPLRAERPLSESMSAVSRDLAAGTAGSQTELTQSGPEPADPGLKTGSQDWPAMWDRLRRSIDNDTDLERLVKDLQAENHGNQVSGAVGEIRPESWAEKTPQTWGEKTAQVGGKKPPSENPPDLPRENRDPAVWGEKTPQPLSLASKASSAYNLGAELSFRGEKTPQAEPTPEDAFRWLESVDRRRTLQQFGADYEELCRRFPDYVLGKLRRHMEEHERFYRQPTERGPDYRLGDPVGWMGKKAAKEGKMRWRGRQS